MKIQIKKELSLPTSQKVVITVTKIQWKFVGYSMHLLACPGLRGNTTGKIAKGLPVTQSTGSASVTRHSINLLAQVQIESAILFVMKYMARL